MTNTDMIIIIANLSKVNLRRKVGTVVFSYLFRLPQPLFENVCEQGLHLILTSKLGEGEMNRKNVLEDQ